ncbi:hypothetical protein evm_015474, partial [Chilo suppressalis]
MVVSWSCELCGRLFATRDEWSAHAKSHLPDNKLLQDKMQQATQHQQQEKVHLSNQEKLQLLHHHNQNQQILNGHGIATASVSTATVVNEGGGGGGAYFTHGHTHYAPERQHTHAHHLCLMCRQEFAGKAEFMFHVRGHFEGTFASFRNSFQKNTRDPNIKYFTHGDTHSVPERQNTHAHHLCLMSRQEFAGKAEFMFHIRGRFQ